MTTTDLRPIALAPGCPRCGCTLDRRDGVRVPRDADAVTRWDGLADVPTITVCYGCVRGDEKAWSAND